MSGELRWMQPAGSAPADYWSVYRNGELILWGIVEEPVAGIYTTPIPGWPESASYWMTASNAGGESEPSNVQELPEPGVELGLLVACAVLALRARLRAGRRACRAASRPVAALPRARPTAS